MRHRISGRSLSRPTGHRRALLRNMVTDLIKHESIRTTDAKAREVRRIAEKVITYGKKGTLSRPSTGGGVPDGRCDGEEAVR